MTFLAVELGRQVTAEEVFASASATGDRRRRRLVLLLEEGESAPSLVSDRRIWGPAVLVTYVWEDGGHHQVVRDRSTITLAEFNALIRTSELPPQCSTDDQTVPLDLHEDEVMPRSQPEHSSHRAALYTAHGLSLTLRQWSLHPRCNAPSYDALRQRVQRLGYSIERALKEQDQSFGSPDHTLYTAFGKTLTLREWALEPECHASVTVRLLRQRVHRQNWSLVRALLTPSPGRKA